MKVFVITDAKGKIAGTVFSASSGDGPFPGRPSPLRGQRIHELTLPPGLEGETSAEVIHRELAKFIRNPKKKSAAGTRKPAKGTARASPAKRKKT
jgi:hypothetical protein